MLFRTGLSCAKGGTLAQSSRAFPSASREAVIHGTLSISPRKLLTSEERDCSLFLLQTTPEKRHKCLLMH